MFERWADIEGYPNYAVSDLGNVINLKTDYLLRVRPNENGYLRVVLSHEGQTRDFYVHQLVAHAFVYDFKPGMRVTHVNGDKNNCSVNNLRLRRGRDIKLLDIERREPWGKRIRIVETGEVFRTVRDCARRIGGDYSSIYGCLRGNRRKHLGFTFEYYEGSDSDDAG